MATAALSTAHSADRDAWIASLRDAIRRGEYRVNPQVVADAALRDGRFRLQLLH